MYGIFIIGKQVSIAYVDGMAGYIKPLSQVLATRAGLMEEKQNKLKYLVFVCVAAIIVYCKPLSTINKWSGFQGQLSGQP